MAWWMRRRRMQRRGKLAARRRWSGPPVLFLPLLLTEWVEGVTCGSYACYWKLWGQENEKGLGRKRKGRGQPRVEVLTG